MDILSDYVEDSLGDRHEMVAEMVYRRCIRELLDEGEWKNAAGVLSDWSEWVYERQELAEMDERLSELEKQQRQS